MINYNRIYDFLLALKHEPWGDFDEYRKHVQEAEVAFRSAFTQYAIEMDGKRIVLFQRDFEDMKQGLEMELAYAQKSKDKERLDWLSFQMKKAEEAVEYIKRVRCDIGGLQADKTPQKQNDQLAISKYEKKLQDYGDFLSVKDLTEIFDCTPRTITNWEEKGWIINVAETSNEINAAGRRKRGQEKRYRKDTIQRSVFLQERFRSLA